MSLSRNSAMSEMLKQVQHDANRGLPIGNLTSQFFANFYMSKLDHYILEKIKPQGFVRYMDDFIFAQNV